MSRIKKPAAEPLVELNPEEIQHMLEEAEDLGVDVEFELFSLGRTPVEVIATARARAAEEEALIAAYLARESAPAPSDDGGKRRPVITADSTRDEVLAAIAAHEADWAETKAYLETLKFPGLDGVDNPKPGCYWSEDGKVVTCVGRSQDEPVHLVRQRAAGEEDQDDGEWAIG